MAPPCGPTDIHLGPPTAANLASRGDQPPFPIQHLHYPLHPRRCADPTADSLSHRRCTKCTTSLSDPTRPPFSRKSDHSRIHHKRAGASWTFTPTPPVRQTGDDPTSPTLPTTHHSTSIHQPRTLHRDSTHTPPRLHLHPTQHQAQRATRTQHVLFELGIVCPSTLEAGPYTP